MTREEAIDLMIKVFDTLEGECNIEYDWSEEHNARDMAIKALEQDSILDVIDKIRAEIKEKFEGYDICEWFEDYDYEENNISEYRSVGNIGEILDIIDKYKEREDKE